MHRIYGPTNVNPTLLVLALTYASVCVSVRPALSESED